MAKKKSNKKHVKNKNKLNDVNKDSKNRDKEKIEIKNKKSKGLIISKKFETIFITVLFVVFFLGFFSGWHFADTSLSEAQIEFQRAELDLQSISERFEFAKIFEEDSCNPELFEQISLNLYNSGIQLEKLEEDNKIETEYYNYLKERHNLNQVFFYSEYKNYFDNCNSTENIVLFFFNGENPEESNKQGEELNKLTEKYNLKILPMDYNYTSKLDYFYDYYKVSNLPVIIINYNRTFEGITNAEDIEKYLRK